MPTTLNTLVFLHNFDLLLEQTLKIDYDFEVNRHNILKLYFRVNSESHLTHFRKGDLSALSSCIAFDLNSLVLL